MNVLEFIGLAAVIYVVILGAWFGGCALWARTAPWRARRAAVEAVIRESHRYDAVAHHRVHIQGRKR